MKLSRKTLSTLLVLLALGCLTGTLIWEVIERLVGALGSPLDLSVGPVSVDLHVVAISIRGNPGSIAGLLGAALLFRGL
jgi:hypothetical protein